jgi:plasmid stabilization system protein ParE
MWRLVAPVPPAKSLPNFGRNMAYKVELTTRALRDIRAIYTFIQADTSGAAAHWFVGLEGAVFSLEQAP